MTNSLTTVLLDKEAISGVWWTIRLFQCDNKLEKLLALWLNSTLGILSFLPNTVITSPNRLSMRKGSLKNLLVLDPTSRAINDARDNSAVTIIKNCIKIIF